MPSLGEARFPSRGEGGTFILVREEIVDQDQPAALREACRGPMHKARHIRCMTAGLNRLGAHNIRQWCKVVEVRFDQLAALRQVAAARGMLGETYVGGADRSAASQGRGRWHELAGQDRLSRCAWPSPLAIHPKRQEVDGHNRGT